MHLATNVAFAGDKGLNMANESTDRTMPLVPASFFAIVLGLAGLANDWRLAHTAWALPAIVGEVLYAIASLVWLLVTVFYSLKWIVALAAAREEAANPIQCCFVALAGVATLLIAQGALPYSRPVAVALFVLGAGFTGVFGLWRTGGLWRGGRAATAATPVLYLPLGAGGFVTGSLAVVLGWRELGELVFGMGFFAWLAIESVVLHRLYTATMPPALRPTLGVQLAPPAVGATCYLWVSGGHSDLFVHMMIGYGLLQAALLLRLIGWIREAPFGTSYWAFTFGATALGGVAIRMSLDDPAGLFAVLAPILFVLVNIVVLAIAAGSIRQLFTGELLAAIRPVVVPEASASSSPAQKV
jgi:tellurite resistance protein